MKGMAYLDAHAGATYEGVTAEDRWNLFKTRCQLENTTKVCMAEQINLETIPDADRQLILEKYRSGTHLRVISQYLQTFYDIQVEWKDLARYWRRTLPGFIEVEQERRELRTAERALKKLVQEDKRCDTN